MLPSMIHASAHVQRTAAGGSRAIVEASLAAVHAGAQATLAIVVETVGSTYVQAGAMALFDGSVAQVGWLSGGCLEPVIAVRARIAAERACIEWMDIDTREDEDLFSGSAVGCRGRLRLALLPLATLHGWAALAEAWLDRQGAWEMTIDASGRIDVRIGETYQHWQLASAAITWADEGEATRLWSIGIAKPPAVVVFGAGPETALLVPLLRTMGWMTTIVEQRARWIAQTAYADRALDASPQAAADALPADRFDAALVMHHNFELDRAALFALANHAIDFIGLLGPNRRREDLFSVLPASARDALATRLHSPIGLKLGGHGPEAIALSIAAQLQAWRHAA